MATRSELQRFAGWEEPGAFIEDACGINLWSGMRLAMQSVWEHQRTSVRVRTLCCDSVLSLAK